MELRSYKRSLRLKYFKGNITKEQLYTLPLPEQANDAKMTRPRGVNDSMWFAFIDLSCDAKFQEVENKREPGPVEWFIKTRVRKDKTFVEPITSQCVDTALNIIKDQTSSSKVVFSEATLEAEKLAYRKLMGDETGGKARGYGAGVYVRDIRNMHRSTESSDVMKLLKTMQNQINVLSAKGNGLATHSPQESVIGSQNGLMHDPPTDPHITRDSLTSWDAFTVSNCLGNQNHRGTNSSKELNQLQDGNKPSMAKKSYTGGVCPFSLQKNPTSDTHVGVRPCDKPLRPTPPEAHKRNFMEMDKQMHNQLDGKTNAKKSKQNVVAEVMEKSKHNADDKMANVILFEKLERLRYAKFVSSLQLIRKEDLVSNTQHTGNKDSKSNAQHVRNQAIMPNGKQDVIHESIMLNAQKEIAKNGDC